MIKQLFLLFFLGLPLWSVAQVPATKGMVWVEAGKASIGFDKGEKDEKPAFETHLAGFWIDQNPVTVGEFKKFVRFTQYITSAEKLGYGVCYDSTRQAWQKVKGASWKYPAGKGKTAVSFESPVRQISWEDAQAYANWLGKRLPSELEWECALQKQTDLQLAYVQTDMWQWCENWYFDYGDSNYFSSKMNRKKSLRAGKHGEVARPSLRYFAAPTDFAFNMGFRCAMDK
jgi:formylglycine-generating enzyme required for sulfatase activity